MLRREVIKMAGGLFGLGKPDPSRFPYAGRPQPSPAVGPSSATIVRANRVIVTGPNGGIYVYSGTPAAGNLLESIGIVANGLDPFGLNAVLQGDTRYHNSGGVFVAQQSAQSYIGYLWQATSALGPYTAMATFVGFTNEFSAAPILELSANQAGGYIQADDPVQLIPVGSAPAASTGPFLYALSSGSIAPAGKLSSGLAGFLSPTQTDITEITAALATGVTITNTWPIPANDSQPGTVYRLTCGGWGTQAGTTAVGLTINVLAFTHVFAGNAMSAATIPAGATFHWKYEVDLIMVTKGATGTARASGKFTWNEAATPGANETVALGQTSSSDTSPCNTTSASSMRATATWASVTNAPTLTCMYSTFERIGP